MLGARLALGVPTVEARETVSRVGRRSEITRDELGVRSDTRDLRNTVCGTTPSFCSSISLVVLRLFSASGSRLVRDGKLSAN